MQTNYGGNKTEARRPFITTFFNPGKNDHGLDKGGTSGDGNDTPRSCFCLTGYPGINVENSYVVCRPEIWSKFWDAKQ